MKLPPDFDQRIAMMTPVQRVRYAKALHDAALAAKPKAPPPPPPPIQGPAPARRRINQAEAERAWLQRQHEWLLQPDLSIILFGTDTHPPMVIPPAPPAYDRELVFLPAVLQRMERLQAHIVTVWKRKREAAGLVACKP